MILHPMMAVCLYGPILASGSQPAAPFFLRGDETVVFFGDSITQAGGYIEYIEAFLATRFPERHFRLLNRGMSSETLAGTSEPDHQPRRPCAHDRFTRDVASANPDVVVACFGMNDGNYFPFEPGRLAKFQQGVYRLEARIREETHARLVLLTPPPFDAYHRLVLDQNAAAFGYKFPAIEYDQTIEQYCRWLLTLRERKLPVVDLHSVMNAHLLTRRRTQVSFGLQADGIHPNATGHWLMAQTLLHAWNAPSDCAEARIDAGDLHAAAGAIRDLRRDGNAFAFTWRTPLPLPSDAQWDRESIALEKVADCLNRYRLAVANLPPGRYRLIADDAVVGEFEQRQIESGLDLSGCPQFPTNVLSRQVLALVQEKQRRTYAAWRNKIGSPLAEPQTAETRPAAQPPRSTAELEQAIRDLCRPKDVTVKLEAISR